MSRRPARRLGAGLLAAPLLVALATASPASAAALVDEPGGARVSHVQATDEGVRVLVSVPAGAEVDLDGVTVTMDGESAEAKAEPAGEAEADTTIERTTVLAIDTSNSMRGERFAAAQQAADAYIAALPDDVRLGIVTFAGDVDDALDPTTDRDAARAVIDGLSLSSQTSLYDGLIAALDMAGTSGQRNVLLLSDGADTTDTPLSEAVTAVQDAGTTLDVVGLEQDDVAVDALTELADAGAGRVVNARSDALEETFSQEAQVLARQVLVTAQVPAGLDRDEAALAVTLPTSAGTVTAQAFALVRTAGADGGATLTPALPAATDRAPQIPVWAVVAGIAMIGVGLLALALGLLGNALRTKQIGVEERVARYAALGGRGPGGQPAVPVRDEPLAQAKDAAEQVLKRTAGLEQRIDRRLQAAGVAFTPAEWFLLHVGVVVGAGLLGALLGGGSLVAGLLFMLVGALVPWLWLGFKKKRRFKAFNAALPDMLQLMSGSLAAGLSLAQSVDTIVREGNEPMASEFKRVLVETRLGVSLEDALEGVTERFESKDFEWVVMAIRIQRQVGGNLAELLNTVAATIREREYLRRQVNTLSAEGRLSAYVLGGLPPAFLLYLVVAQGEYVRVLYTTPIGLLMLAGAGVLLAVGAFWMSRLVNVEV